MVEFNINYLFQTINFIILLVLIGLPIYLVIKVTTTLSDIQKSNKRIESILGEVNEKLKIKD